MFGFSLAKVVRGFGLALPLLAGLAAGCSTGYPTDLHYPPRMDPLVLEPPKDDNIFSPIPPGQLEQSVAGLKDKGGKLFDPKGANVPGKRRQELTTFLDRVFGTPSRPHVAFREDSPAKGIVETKAITEAVATLDLDAGTLRHGSTLYRRHCLHCHGLAGDGRGPTGPWVSPHPRDYRQGVFKFISTSNSLTTRKARREDLVRTLQKGIEGTSMPAFGLLPDFEVNQLASYVILLALRGETEFEALKQFSDGDKEFKDYPNPDADSGAQINSFEDFIEAQAQLLLKHWATSTKTPANTPEKPPKECEPDPTTLIPPKDSIIRGYKKFTEASGDAACLKCHIDFGRQALYRYDKWGTLVRPANLTLGVYRGGRRPVDIYYRIIGGIEGCGMPGSKALTPKEYWDLVNFVQTMPYPKMLPDEIRDKVYVPEKPLSPGAEKGH